MVTILYGTSATEPWTEYILGVYSSYDAAVRAIETFRDNYWIEFRLETWEVKN